MHAVEKIENRTDNSIGGNAWILSSSSHKTGTDLRYFRYRLWIRGQEFDSFIWEKDQNVHWPVKPGAQIQFSGEWSGARLQSSIRLTQIETRGTDIPIDVARHVYQCPVEKCADQFIHWISNLENPLKQFLCELFTNESIAIPFVKLPASLKHHHAYPGGLFEHSLESALMCGQLGLPWLNRKEAELTMVAGFLHDVGKIQTYRREREFSDTGYFVSHDVLTLEVLAPALTRLQQRWSTGANLLRNILTWDQSRDGHPAFPGALMVKMADRLSTNLDRRKQAFSDHPNWHHHARSGQFRNEKYLRVPA